MAARKTPPKETCSHDTPATTTLVATRQRAEIWGRSVTASSAEGTRGKLEGEALDALLQVIYESWSYR